MKSMISGLIVLLAGLNVFASQYSKTDLQGRLIVMDQAQGQVRGTVTVTQSDSIQVLQLAEVQLNIAGKNLTGSCSGEFNNELQALILLCEDDSSVLRIDLAQDSENQEFYRAGSFSSAKLIYSSLDSLDKAKAIQVDVKNSNLKQ